MFLSDLKEEFYKEIRGKKLLVLVNFDIDALCAFKILQSIFHSDNTLYTLHPVEGVEDLKQAYSSHSDQAKYVMLVNCGGTTDIVELLNPSDDVIFFVIDSHRPIDVCNVYSSGQVRLMTKPDDDEDIPEFDDIFAEESGSDEERDHSQESEDGEDTGRSEAGNTNKLKAAEDRIMKRKERRLWKEKRDRIMFDYTQFSFYGRSCALNIFDMVWHLGKDSLDLLWWAIVGVTYQLTLGHIQGGMYTKELPVLQLHMSRLMKSAGEPISNSLTNSMPQLKISSQKDLQMILYRHWTVEASLRNSLYTTIKLRLWNLGGQKRLLQLLAEIGLPLSESRQKYSAMESSSRNCFIAMMEQAAQIYDLDELIYPSFSLSYGYRKNFQATDYVYGILGLMEPSVRNLPVGNCFSDALDALSREKNKVLMDGIELSKRMLTCVFKNVQILIDMKQVISAGPFLYFVLQEGALDVRMFGHFLGLGMLAKATLQAFHSLHRERRIGNLPLIASAPVYPSEGSCIIVGIPPVLEVLPRNFFGKAFTQAAEIINIEPYVYFENAAIKINIKDRIQFFNALSSMLR